MGTIASDTRGSVDPEPEFGIVTVYVALPETTLPSGLLETAVIVGVPEPTAVASPVAELTVATEESLEVHCDLSVRFTVAPEVKVPMAMN